MIKKMAWTDRHAGGAQGGRLGRPDGRGPGTPGPPSGPSFTFVPSTRRARCARPPSGGHRARGPDPPDTSGSTSPSGTPSRPSTWWSRTPRSGTTSRGGRPALPGQPDEARPSSPIYRAAQGSAPDEPPPSRCTRLPAVPCRLGRIEAAAILCPRQRPCARGAAGLRAEGDRALCRGGADPEAEKARLAFAPDFTAAADDAALAEFRGRMDSVECPARRPREELCRPADHRPLRHGDGHHGVEPHAQPLPARRDALGRRRDRFAGGFDNLPLPKSPSSGTPRARSSPTEGRPPPTR
jgi:hypothetical protein